MLVSSLKDSMLILLFFFKIELRRAALVDYLFDVLTIFEVDVWRY